MDRRDWRTRNNWRSGTKYKKRRGATETPPRHRGRSIFHEKVALESSSNPCRRQDAPTPHHGTHGKSVVSKRPRPMSCSLATGPSLLQLPFDQCTENHTLIVPQGVGVPSCVAPSFVVPGFWYLFRSTRCRSTKFRNTLVVALSSTKLRITKFCSTIFV